MMCCVCGAVSDLSAGGDAGTATGITTDEGCDQPALRSWPPKSHTSGAPVAGSSAVTSGFHSEVLLLQILSM